MNRAEYNFMKAPRAPITMARYEPAPYGQPPYPACWVVEVVKVVGFNGRHREVARAVLVAEDGMTIQCQGPLRDVTGLAAGPARTKHGLAGLDAHRLGADDIDKATLKHEQDAAARDQRARDRWEGP